MQYKPVRVLATIGEMTLWYKPDTLGLYRNDLASMKLDMDSAISAYLGAAAGIPDPDCVSDITGDIADWYSRTTDPEQLHRSSRSYTFRDGLWRYRDLILVPEDENLRRRCIAINDPQAMEGRGDGHRGEFDPVRMVMKRMYNPFPCFSLTASFSM